MPKKFNTIGVVGLGLMGSSIIVSFLKAGCRVVAISPLASELEIGTQRVLEQLRICEDMRLLSQERDKYVKQLTITDDYLALRSCDLVAECVIEVEEIKQKVYQKIEKEVRADCLISTNTSAIPINLLQKYFDRPHRFMGIHWAEPAYSTRFLEITCGETTDVSLAEWVQEEAATWDKEPTLLYKDIRGFITNRIMYAVYRQGFELINQGIVDMPGLDKCFQYEIGQWVTIMGIFRRMDFDGLDNYMRSYQAIFPRLTKSDTLPPQMSEILDVNGKGIHNLKGLYQHSKDSAQELENNFSAFSEEIYRLADQYRNKLKQLDLAESNGKDGKE